MNEILLRDANKQRTRMRIVDAAKEAFVEKGYATTTMSHIADRAGIGRATLYLHFTTKLEITDEIARSLGPRMVMILRDLSARSFDQAGLEGWIADLLAGLRSFGPLAKVVNEAIGNNRELVDTLISSMRDTAADIAQDLRRAGRWPEKLSVGSLALLMTSTTYLVTVVFSLEPMPDDKQLTQELAGLWLKALA
jgi:AcrR family transcriptional regulator